jgi:hypothetical protein
MPIAKSAVEAAYQRRGCQYIPAKLKIPQAIKEAPNQ